MFDLALLNDDPLLRAAYEVLRLAPSAAASLRDHLAPQLDGRIARDAHAFAASADNGRIFGRDDLEQLCEILAPLNAKIDAARREGFETVDEGYSEALVTRVFYDAAVNDLREQIKPLVELRELLTHLHALREAERITAFLRDTQRR
ncbi:hypothetical protein OE699_09350 [Sedimentimonas flavescens]|uniref:HPt domain-containing protein n=1 Tax=Sedimentimonas flavescens TaxID=2851012 RepID=A0ABT3A0I1_9RHOB|nr:hypothetical protein [Sedimentimonas flavescens]MCV2879060.1 hypothetical protein [Sedimentimonas flavescens]